MVADDPDRSEEQGRSQVRDSEDSLEVIALWRGADGHLSAAGLRTSAPGGLDPRGPGMGNRLGAVPRARDGVLHVVAADPAWTNPGVIDRAIAELERTVDYSGWQTSPWLKGQLRAVVFGPDDRAALAGFDLHYTVGEGLVVTHPKEEL